LKGQKEDTYNFVQLTFQIGLHVDDRKVLENIKNIIHCGIISESGDRVNLFVNDFYSIKNIILPIFEHFGLRSSKIHSYNIFKQAVEIIQSKRHLTTEGKLEIMKIRVALTEYFNTPQLSNPTYITLYWLLGFIEGEASFSTSNLQPRLKFENSIVEENLYKLIKDSLGLNSQHIQYPKVRDRGLNDKEVIVLNYFKIEFLYLDVIPALSQLNWYTKKELDFKDWSIIVKLDYYGYHLTPEGSKLIRSLKSRMNNFRLTNNNVNKELSNFIISQKEIDSVFYLEAPYDVYGGLRVKAGTLNLISRPLIIVTRFAEDPSGDLLLEGLPDCKTYKSITLLAKELSLDRTEVIK
jgi:hypothetical protein